MNELTRWADSLSITGQERALEVLWEAADEAADDQGACEEYERVSAELGHAGREDYQSVEYEISATRVVSAYVTVSGGPDGPESDDVYQALDYADQDSGSEWEWEIESEDGGNEVKSRTLAETLNLAARHIISERSFAEIGIVAFGAVAEWAEGYGMPAPWILAYTLDTLTTPLVVVAPVVAPEPIAPTLTPVVADWEMALLAPMEDYVMPAPARHGLVLAPVVGNWEDVETNGIRTLVGEPATRLTLNDALALAVSHEGMWCPMCSRD